MSAERIILGTLRTRGLFDNLAEVVSGSRQWEFRKWHI